MADVHTASAEIDFKCHQKASRSDRLAAFHSTDLEESLRNTDAETGNCFDLSTLFEVDLANKNSKQYKPCTWGDFKMSLSAVKRQTSF